MSIFDLKAREWDSNQVHFERSMAVSSFILKKIPIHSKMIALEFGSGTGILSFLLRQYFQKIVLMDSSVEMIKVCQEKINKEKITNLFPVYWDLEQESYFTEPFDIIFSQMAFHHLKNIKDVLVKLKKILKEGGYVAIADLYSEDGSFHGEPFDGHKGFEVDELKEIFMNVGFDGLEHETCFTIERITDEGIKRYPIFLLTGQKPSL